MDRNKVEIDRFWAMLWGSAQKARIEGARLAVLAVRKGESARRWKYRESRRKIG